MTPYIDVGRARASSRVYRVVQSVLEGVQAAKRYQDRSVSEGEGDTFRHHARGGIWNDRTGRAAHGIALADVAVLRRKLRTLGAKLTTGDADALLLQAEMGALVMAPPPATPEQERTKKANRREKARANGLCIVCATRPQREGRVTCQECSDAAKERVRASRSKA